MKAKFKFSSNAWDHNNVRLTNQIFKLLPMYENDEEWEKQQGTIILELHGYNEMFQDSPGFMVLIAKLAALTHAEDKFTFRKLVFEAITELKNIKEV
jgi:hypothetical protein